MLDDGRLASERAGVQAAVVMKRLAILTDDNQIANGFPALA